MLQACSWWCSGDHKWCCAGSRNLVSYLHPKQVPYPLSSLYPSLYFNFSCSLAISVNIYGFDSQSTSTTVLILLVSLWLSLPHSALNWWSQFPLLGTSVSYPEVKILSWGALRVTEVKSAGWNQETPGLSGGQHGVRRQDIYTELGEHIHKCLKKDQCSVQWRSLWLSSGHPTSEATSQTTGPGQAQAWFTPLLMRGLLFCPPFIPGQWKAGSTLLKKKEIRAGAIA